MDILKKLTLGCSLVCASTIATAGVVGTIGSAPYLAGDVVKGAAKLVLSSGEGIVNIDENSSVAVNKNPLTLSLHSGSACVNLGASKSLDITDLSGNAASFSAKNAASVAAMIDGGKLVYKEVAACDSFALANSTSSYAALGEKKERLLPLLLGVGAAVVISNDDDDPAPAASPVQ